MLRFKAHRCILRLCVVCPVWSQINFHYLHKMKTDNSFTIGAVCVEIGFNKELFGELGQQGGRWRREYKYKGWVTPCNTRHAVSRDVTTRHDRLLSSPPDIDDLFSGLES